jgi:hypothetical protein
MLAADRVVGDLVGAFRHQAAAGGAGDAADDRTERAASEGPDAEAGEAARRRPLRFIGAAGRRKQAQGAHPENSDTHVDTRYG